MAADGGLFEFTVIKYFDQKGRCTVVPLMARRYDVEAAKVKADGSLGRANIGRLISN